MINVFFLWLTILSKKQANRSLGGLRRTHARTQKNLLSNLRPRHTQIEPVEALRRPKSSQEAPAQSKQIAPWEAQVNSLTL